MKEGDTLSILYRSGGTVFPHRTRICSIHRSEAVWGGKPPKKGKKMVAGPCTILNLNQVQKVIVNYLFTLKLSNLTQSLPDSAIPSKRHFVVPLSLETVPNGTFFNRSSDICLWNNISVFLLITRNCDGSNSSHITRSNLMTIICFSKPRWFFWKRRHSCLKTIDNVPNFVKEWMSCQWALICPGS